MKQGSLRLRLEREPAAMTPPVMELAVANDELNMPIKGVAKLYIAAAVTETGHIGFDR